MEISLFVELLFACILCRKPKGKKIKCFSITPAAICYYLQNKVIFFLFMINLISVSDNFCFSL